VRGAHDRRGPLSRGGGGGGSEDRAIHNGAGGNVERFHAINRVHHVKLQPLGKLKIHRPAVVHIGAVGRLWRLFPLQNRRGSSAHLARHSPLPLRHEAVCARTPTDQGAGGQPSPAEHARWRLQTAHACRGSLARSLTRAPTHAGARPPHTRAGKGGRAGSVIMHDDLPANDTRL
jgi:hypothetical protein